jgi:phosphoglycerol transferase MdoB-like AlkP superfamily enzyme
MNKGVSFIFAGLATILASYLLMMAAGLGGIIFTPFFYILGPGLTLYGIIWTFKNRGVPGGKRNVIIILASLLVLIVVLIIGFVISAGDNARDAYCDQKYPYTGGLGYDNDPNTQCLRHQID